MKLICGDPREFPVLAPGQYFTAINVHNPHHEAIAFRKKIYLSVEELQQDLDVWMDRYNDRRTHQGKRCQGRTPMATFMENLPMAQEKMINREEVALVA